MTVAEIILQQLGGRKFIAMTGARHFLSTGNGLRFKIPYPSINFIEIELTPDDLYQVKFYYVRGRTVRLVKQLGQVYAGRLAPLFTEVTGLATHL